MTNIRHLQLLILILSISCTRKIDETKSTYFSETNFSLDTVFVDTGDDFLFLNYALISSGIDEDCKYLYNFNEHDVAVEKINLDELKLEEKLDFEREGPNGIGVGMGMMRVVDNNHISITGMYQSSLFSMDGQKLVTVYYEDFSLAEWHMGGDFLKGDRVILDPYTNRLYGLIQGYDNNTFELGIFYLNEFEMSRMELISFEKAPDYSFMYYLGKGSIINEPIQVGIEKFGNKIILSNEVTNALMWYDSERDTLFMKSYDSRLTADHKEKKYKREHETPKQFEAEYARYREEINFIAPFWDKESQRFYRFSYEEKGGNTTVYLTAYDEELNLLGETVVPELTKKPAKHFAKDGKIWIYENLDDEMAFVRLGFN